MEKYFTIIAGRKEPAKVLQGTLNKTTGLPDPNAQKVAVVVGQILIPNYSRVWAKRIISNPPAGVKKNDYISVSHKDYRGEIEFLEYGEPGGEEIDIRFLPNSGSLDKLYQDTVQKLLVQQEDAVIMLMQGVNNFDPKTQSMKIQMLKHHGLNRDNKSRNPLNIDWDFFEYNSASHRADKVKALEVQALANEYVINAKNDNKKLQILAEIFRIDTMTQNEDIVDMLADKAKDNPALFIKTITDYQHAMTILLSDGVKDGMIKITKEGRLSVVTENGEERIIDGIEGEGRDKIAWLVSKALVDPSIFASLKEVDKQLTTLRKQFV